MAIFACVAGAPSQAQSTASRDTIFVADRYISTTTAGAEVTAKFNSASARVALLRLDAPVATRAERRWVLGDILVNMDLSGNGIVAIWKVAGPRDVIDAYLSQIRDLVQKRSPVYDASIRSLTVRCACDDE